MDSSKPKQPAAKPVDDEARTVAPLVDSFAERISRRLEEKELSESKNAAAGQDRYHLIMQALTFVRKALQEATKIRLGQRFFLATEVSDADGWPKILLLVKDRLAPEWDDLGIETRANDRQEDGLIQIESKRGEKFLSFSILEPDALQRLPLHLKKALRRFLDEVETYVLDPIKPEALLSTQTTKIQTKHDQPTSSNNPLGNTNVFDDQLPSLSDAEEKNQSDAPLHVDIFSTEK